jgi:hypothetical protein
VKTALYSNHLNFNVAEKQGGHPSKPLYGDETAFARLVWSDLTPGVVMQSSLKCGFRYFNVPPIKAFRDIRPVHRQIFFATVNLTPASEFYMISLIQDVMNGT